MNTTTNIIVVVILVLLVGFGVWYFTSGRQAPAEEGPAIELNVGGGSGGGGGSSDGGGY
jgi:hypothetical protein